MTEYDILKTAILNEVEGYQFYTLAAARADDADVKEAFLHLAHEEEKHESWLRKMMSRLRNRQDFSEEEFDTSSVPSPLIFNIGQTGTESGSLEISVYKIGILMEMASREFYRQAAQKAQTPALKKLFWHLADWEDIHLEFLETIYDHLKQEWWDKQGFSPA